MSTKRSFARDTLVWVAVLVVFGASTYRQLGWRGLALSAVVALVLGVYSVVRYKRRQQEAPKSESPKSRGA